MGKWIQRGVLAILLVVFAVIIKDYLSPLIPRTPTKDERLKDDEDTKVIVDVSGDVSQVRRKKGKDGKDEQVVHRDTGARDTQIILKKDGTLEVRQRTKGFIFEPGIGIGFDGDALLVVDTQFFFMRNLGLTAGLGVPLDSIRANKLRLHVAGSYRLPFKAFRNTSAYVGYSTKKEFQFGVRVRF